jgi:hypothetical protein
MSRSTISRFGFPAQEGRASVIFLKRIFFVCLLLSMSVGCATSPDGGRAAHLETQNVYEVALSPFYLVVRSSIDADHAWNMTLNVSSGMPIAGFLKPNQMLMESFTRWIYSLEPIAGKVLNVNGESDIAADCEGAYSGQIQMASNGRFTGKLVFSKFADDCSLVLDGEVPFAGSLDLASGVMIAELSFSSLNGELGEDELSMQGDLELEFNAFKGEKQASTGISELALADAEGARFRLDDMEFAWDHSGQYQKLSVNGMINLAGIGSLRLATTSPLQISNIPGRLVTAYKNDGTPAHTTHKRRLPFDGALRFYGADKAWVRLLFSKPTLPGFFWIDTSAGSQSIGNL